MLFLRISIAAMAACLSFAPHMVVAQESFDPATEVFAETMFPGAAPNAVQVALVLSADEFADEVLARDAAGVFAPTIPTGIQNAVGSDILVGIFDDFPQAIATYRYYGIPAAVNILERQSIQSDTFLNYGTIDTPERTVHLFNFVRTVAGDEASETCMARFLVDTVYRGLGQARIPVMACSRAISASQ